jgi:hypothetical protein
MLPGYDSAKEWLDDLYGRNDSDYLDQPDDDDWEEPDFEDDEEDE